MSVAPLGSDLGVSVPPRSRAGGLSAPQQWGWSLPAPHLLQVEAVDPFQPLEFPDAGDVLPVQADGGGGQQPPGAEGTRAGGLWGALNPASLPAQHEK